MYYPDQAEYIRGSQENIALFVRRWRLILFSAIAVIAVSIAIAYLWPPIYRSEAVILIENPEVPQDMIQTTVTSAAAERIQIIRQRVTTTENLTKLIDQFGLYADQRQSVPTTQIIQRFRDDIGLDTIVADIADPRTGRPMKATLAFEVSYENGSPRLSQQVANELVTYFLAENIRERRGQASETAEFLSQESERLASQIRQLESRLAEFKKKYAGKLPDQLVLNFDIAQRTERELEDVSSRLRGLQERQTFLETQLANTTPHLPAATPGDGMLPQSPAAQLETLRSEFSRLRGTYGEAHPEAVRMSQEIRALESLTEQTRNARAISRDLDQAKEELAALRERYSSEHPDVRRLQTTVDRLAAELATARSGEGISNAADTATNPVFVQLISQLNALQAEREGLLSHQAALQQKLQSYESRLLATPDVERQYLALMRDYENAKAKFKETKDKHLAAVLSQSLETESKGERFTLIEPPQVPVNPIRPKRQLIMGGGGALGLAFGFGLVFLLSVFDQRIYNGRRLAAVTGEPPLVMIPDIRTSADRLRSTAVVGVWIVGIATFSGLALWYVHEYVQPLDVLVYERLRQLTI